MLKQVQHDNNEIRKQVQHNNNEMYILSSRIHFGILLNEFLIQYDNSANEILKQVQHDNNEMLKQV